jgi:5-methylcytosine-specific restriction endonuclease McrA
MASKWLTKKNRTRVLKRDSFICCYCLKECENYTDRTNDLDYATLDHIIPRDILFKLASTLVEYNKMVRDINNLVCVCNACNSSKKHEELEAWCNRKGIDYNAVCNRIAARIGQ